MTTPSTDAHVRLDVHPHHSSAVTAVLTGSQAHIAHVALEADNWSVVGKNTLVLARIDHEEPYWAEWAAEQLTADGVTVEITPKLREAMDEEWTWPTYPMPWCTRTEIRHVSNEAQKIHDDIRHGHLLIHAHAEDSHTTVAVGTYLSSGKSVYLHGEAHLRQVADTFDSPAAALVAFEMAHGDAMRPGPAPLTDTEQDTARALSSPGIAPRQAEPPQPEPETVPAYAADADDHGALLDTFLEAHRDWQKWRAWSDETTHAVHESLVIRAEFVHEAGADDVRWKIAAYESPVGERLWHATATATVPVDIVRTLLESLDSADTVEIAAGSEISEANVWKATVRCSRPTGTTASTAAPSDGRHQVVTRQVSSSMPSQRTSGSPTCPSGRSGARAPPTPPEWALHFSTHTAIPVLQDIAVEAASRYAEPLASARRQNSSRTPSPVPAPHAAAPARPR